MRYTFSDEDEDGSDAASTRRTTRNSGVTTPAEPKGPMFTASGRQVKARARGEYGETLLSGHNINRVSPATAGAHVAVDGQDQAIANGRSRRSGLRKGVDGWKKGGDHIAGYNSVDEMGSESSEGEWDGGDDDDEVDEPVIDDDEADDEDMSEHDSDADDDGAIGRSLVVQLRFPGKGDALMNGYPKQPESPGSSSEQPATITISHDHPKQAIITNGQPKLATSDSGTDKMATSPILHDAIQVLPLSVLQDNSQAAPPPLESDIRTRLDG